MLPNPRVAIIVLNYNGEDCLPRCLFALQKLTYQNIQVVVVDNDSQDHSLADAQKNFPHCIFLKKETNSGFAAGVNTGIQYALAKNFDFVWLMNNDAAAIPNSLSVLIEAHQENPDIQAMSPVIKNTNGSIWFAGGRINYWRMRTEHFQKITKTNPYPTGFLTGCAPLFHTNIFKKVGMFDERFFLYYEDADFSKRILKSGEQLFVVPKSLVIHAEKSTINPQKIYYLVHFGLLFFALHTPKSFRFYMVLYVTIRRLVNQFKLLLGLSMANLVAQAYADYFRKFQAGYQLYLRKLS